MLLSEIKPGETAIVQELDVANPNSRRLMEMGIVPGISVTIIKSAPLGDPLEIRIRGYNLAIRKNDAATIIVDNKSEVQT